MNTIAKSLIIKSIIINISAILLIYFTPALSHLLSFPLYLAEPMRLMLILAMVHSNRNNAMLLALTLPLFSYAVSGHPEFYKMLLISAELMLNVWLFYLFSDKVRNIFAAMLAAIVLSKIAYYVVKALMISVLAAGTGLFSTPIWIQLITTAIFSLYAFLMLKKRSQ